MNPMTHTVPVGRNNPITAFEPADPCLPAHMAAAFNTPPKGYLHRTRDTHRRPNGGSMFITHIPRNAADASTYIANMQFPHTRTSRAIQTIVHAEPPPIGVLYGFLATMMATAALSLGADSGTWPFIVGMSGIALCATALVLFFAFVTTAMALETYIDKNYDTCYPTAPTKLMRTIHDRSINVTPVMPGLADKAWKVYLYDVEHYDEYANIIADIAANPAEYGTKTYAVQREILDTFWRTSLLRQKAVQRDIDAKMEHIAQQRQAEQTQTQTQAAISDEMHAETLETTVLDKLKADEAAARVIYGDSDNAD